MSATFESPDSLVPDDITDMWLWPTLSGSDVVWMGIVSAAEDVSGGRHCDPLSKEVLRVLTPGTFANVTPELPPGVRDVRKSWRARGFEQEVTWGLG